MTVSKLARASIITTKRNTRTQKVTKFTPHYMCAKWTGEQCATYFRDCDRQCSANYCIGYDGGIVCNVPEEYRAWTSSSSWNDQRAITVECANLPDGSLTDATWKSLVKLGADVMRRYGFRPWYTGDSSGTITEHRMFASTDCPGPWLHPRMGQLAVAIKNELDGTTPAPAPKPKPKPVMPNDKPERTVPPMSKMHRLCNPSGDHMYTADESEFKTLVSKGWKDEGVMGETAPGVQLFRLYNNYNGQHLFTTDLNEATKCIDAGWKFEGVAGIVNDGDVNVYRLYQKNNGNHFYTTSKEEANTLIKTGNFSDEGVAYRLS